MQFAIRMKKCGFKQTLGESRCEEEKQTHHREDKFSSAVAPQLLPLASHNNRSYAVDKQSWATIGSRANKPVSSAIFARAYYAGADLLPVSPLSSSSVYDRGRRKGCECFRGCNARHVRKCYKDFFFFFSKTMLLIC